MIGNLVFLQNLYQQGWVKIWQLCLDFMVKVLMDWKLNLYVGLKKMKFVYEFKMKVLDYL